MFLLVVTVTFGGGVDIALCRIKIYAMAAIGD
jgi:hypothetical protein